MKTYFGENSVTYLLSLIKTALNTKVGKDDIVDSLDSADSAKALSARQGSILKQMIESRGTGSGDGDMLKSTYDVNGDGIVDNAAALEGHKASEFAMTGEAAETIASMKGQVNGLCPLGTDGKVASQYLPSYVDGIVEGYFNTEDGQFYEDAQFTTKITGDRDLIYVDVSTSPGTSYRFGGTTYAEISSTDLVEMTTDEIKSLWDAIMAA